MLTDIESQEYNTWFNSQIQDNKNLEFINTIYWRLETISCVLVLRNKFWFNKVLPSIELFWNNLVDERESGRYIERKKKKRKLELEDNKSKSDFPKLGCLIDPKLFEDPNVVNCTNKNESEKMEVDKVFTIDTEPYKPKN